MTKKKADYQLTEVEITSEDRELVENSTDEEVATGTMLTGRAPVGQGEDLFEDLVASISEAGAILRGEREAARRTNVGETETHGGQEQDRIRHPDERNPPR